MKKLIAVILIILLSSPAALCWELHWDDPGDEDGIIIYYKPYPAGYSYPDNLAPAEKIMNVDGATRLTLPENTTSWKIPDSLEMGERYVFWLQATLAGSVSGYSDFLCFTFSDLSDVTIIELPPAQGNIQINIYQPLR